MTFSLFTLTALLLAPGLQATAVVVFRTPDRIVLASDSLQQSTEGQRTTLCKVRQAGRWWLTLSGYTGSKAPPVDAWQLVTSAITTARTLDDVRAAIERSVFPRVAAGLETARALKGFANLFEEGAPVAMILVAGTDVDDPTLRVGIFEIAIQHLEPFQLASGWVGCPGLACPDGSLYFGASVPGPTVQLVSVPRQRWVERADSEAAFRIITRQIAATPGDVSPPIDVLELTARGAQWMNRDASSRCNPLPKG